MSQKRKQAEMSPEFSDTARAALLWVLWHHQGGSSPVGQPIRFALGMSAHDSLSEHQVQEAKRWAALTKSESRDFHRGITQPHSAEPVNEQLVKAVENLLSWIDDYAETSDPCFPAVEKQAQDALSEAKKINDRPAGDSNG